MVMKVDYSSRLAENSKGRPKAKSRMEIAAENSPRAKVRALLSKHTGRLSPKTKKKLRKIFFGVIVVGCFTAIVGGLWFFSYLQRLDAALPPVENPFQDKELASVIYDRNGKELYKLFNEYNRDPLDIKEIPAQVKWAFLASEDVDFYVHKGFDPIAIVRCGVLSLRAGGVSCGGSTVTQQIVKITTNQIQQTLDRKFSEILFAIKIEQAYTKDEILQLYLQVAPFGSNIYGLSSAADFYFNKQPKDLTLAEATLLAGVIQSPVYYSPTIPNTDEQKQRAKSRQENHVLHQMKVHMAQINAQHRKNIDDPEADDLLTEELIEAAVAEELKYVPPIATNKKAGHAVDYALIQLQQKNFKNGTEPFTLSDLQVGGYKVYTTIDYDLQQIAEQTVADAVASYGGTYSFSNAAVITTRPKTGEIITMVGSKSYYGVSAGCDAANKNCEYDPQVNVLNTPQSPGSSTKPMGSYEAYKQGKLFPASLVPDVPIDLGGGYTVKNWNSTFFGVTDKTSSGQMLRESRNLPAIITLEIIGIPRFLEVMREFGYTTYNNAAQFGPSVILGGADVIPIEHAQGYGVFANEGNLVPVTVISKIVDRQGNTVYEHKPEPKKVADEKAAYLINQSLLNNHFLSWDGRDVAAKSGTSENSTDAWIANWSPDFVTIAWVGNNNNRNMDLNAFGENAVSPWVKNYMRQIGDSEYFAAATDFPRPGGIVSIPGCSGECENGAVGLNSGIRMGIEGVNYPVDIVRKKVRVCKDQGNRLARPIDEATGNATDLWVSTYIMPAPSYQKYLDKYMKESGNPNGGPDQQCDIDRAGSGINGPFFQNLSITMTGPNTVRYSGNVYSTTNPATQVRFYFDCNGGGNCNGAKEVGTPLNINGNNFDVTITLPATPAAGNYTAMVRATNGSQNNFSNPVQLTVGTAPTAAFVITPTGGTRTITYTLAPAMNLNNVRLFVSANGGTATQVPGTESGNGPYTWNWNVPSGTATYTFYMVGSIPGTTTGTYTSPVSNAGSITD